MLLGRGLLLVVGRGRDGRAALPIQMLPWNVLLRGERWNVSADTVVGRP